MSVKSFENKYSVVDVETPNARNNSICSIAIMHIENSIIKFQKEFLVNPEAEFDNMNISIHKITPKMVENAPTFPVIWEEIKGYFVDGIVVAHNANFDLTVIGKTLSSYCIPMPEINFICTLKKARRHISKEMYGNHKLNVLCDAFSIDLDNHHNALCDVIACRELFETFSNRYGMDCVDVSTYKNSVDNRIDITSKSNIQKSMNILYGIIVGIGCDCVIKKDEHIAIYNWMEENKNIQNHKEISKYFKLLQEILDDDFITYEEYIILIEMIRPDKKAGLYTDSTLSMQILNGIVRGITSDRAINNQEAEALFSWMKTNELLKGNYPFDKIFNKLEEVLKNGVVEKEEEQQLIEICEQFINPEKVCCTAVEWDGKVCCLTGTFISGTKSDIEEIILSRGGFCVSSLNKNVDYLIVGGKGSHDWKYGNYGGKISKAVEMQEKGSGIQIMNEESL